MTEQTAPESLEPSVTDVQDNGALATGPPACGARSSRTLSRSLRAPGEARRFVEEHICTRHGNGVTGSVALVASEVVTHAVLRGEGPVSIGLECDATSLTLTVSCWTGAASGAAEPSLGDGVSCLIIDSICRASGAEHTERGLTMWCTIPARAPRPALDHLPGRAEQRLP